VANFEAAPGTIRYIDQGVGKRPKAEKYYALKVSYPKNPYDGPPPDYGYKYLTDFNFYNQFIPDIIVQFLPDSSVNIDKLGIVSPRSFQGKTGFHWTLDNQTAKILETTYNDDKYYLYSGEEEGAEIYYMFGYKIYAGWAYYKKTDKEEKIPDETAPGALDNDWTLEQVKDKQEEINQWVNANLLPPIFGQSNCVYFPSNLDGYKLENYEKNPWGIISQYPVSGLRIQSESEYLITGIKDSVYTISTLIPFYTVGDGNDRFPMRIDEDGLFSNEGDDYDPDAEVPVIPDKPKKKEIPDSFYKQGVCFNAKFFNKDSKGNYTVDSGYSVNCIITQVSIPDNPEVKGNVTFKFLTDLNLTEDQYFSAAIVVNSQKYTNYVQNETYSIKPYYDKSLGVGPRLGGSIMGAMSNDTSGQNPDFSGRTDTTIYYYVSVLKDNPKVNIPYKDGITFEGYFAKYYLSDEKYNLTHTFQASDARGQFIKLDYPGVENYFNQPAINDLLTAQYYPDFKTYLIKNLDEHNYDYYQNLKRSAQLNQLNVFLEKYENPNLSFDSK
jgi:hypothetical protein